MNWQTVFENDFYCVLDCKDCFRIFVKHDDTLLFHSTHETQEIAESFIWALMWDMENMS